MIHVIRHGFYGAVPGGDIGLPDPPPYAGNSGTMTVYVGPMTISTPGAVLDHKTINGMVLVRAPNVTFSNCRINAGNSFWGIDAEGSTGLVLDHCTITGNLFGGNACILTGDNWQVTNCNLSGLDNGIICQGGTGLAEGNYIHGLGRPPGTPPGTSPDGIQLNGFQDGVVIRRNWIESWSATDIKMLANGGSGINNILIEDNTLIVDPAQPTTTAQCIMVNSVGTSLVTGVVISRNRMQAGSLGYVTTDVATPVMAGNVDYFTGFPAP